MLITLAYLRAASRASASVLAPVHTIFPELKISAVVFGLRMRMMAAAKRCAECENRGRREFGARGGVSQLRGKNSLPDGEKSHRHF